MTEENEYKPTEENEQKRYSHILLYNMKSMEEHMKTMRKYIKKHFKNYKSEELAKEESDLHQCLLKISHQWETYNDWLYNRIPKKEIRKVKKLAVA